LIQDFGARIERVRFSGLGDTGYGMGVAVGDIDNDSHIDVYVSNYGPDVLYRNNGDGTFTDISEAAGIGDPDVVLKPIAQGQCETTRQNRSCKKYVTRSSTDLTQPRVAFFKAFGLVNVEQVS
jgi:hypothetical protein